jgi:hypothetical protein
MHLGDAPGRQALSLGRSMGWSTSCEFSSPRLPKIPGFRLVTIKPIVLSRYKYPQDQLECTLRSPTTRRGLTNEELI